MGSSLPFGAFEKAVAGFAEDIAIVIETFKGALAAGSAATSTVAALAIAAFIISAAKDMTGTIIAAEIAVCTRCAFAVPIGASALAVGAANTFHMARGADALKIAVALVATFAATIAAACMTLWIIPFANCVAWRIFTDEIAALTVFAGAIAGGALFLTSE